ncbi:SipW-dependent-type signal peptide-containing protein [Arthrobacter sp. NPDC090010]|uniref:SipW-dependent-type signal peptide-containing protein n=1 Tax=Arthrobacter sp. NPDC090010 TaxID=3363942 RepID=UPI0038138D11
MRVRGGWIAAVAACAVVLSAVPTSAAWTDNEWTKGSGLSATTIPPATLSKPCVYNPGVLGLGAKITIYWRAPAGYALANSVMYASQSGLGSVLAPLTGFSMTTSTTVSGADYVTDVPVNLLGGLLGLGAELELAIVMKNGTWTSVPVKVKANPGLVGGLGGSCTNIG